MSRQRCRELLSILISDPGVVVVVGDTHGNTEWLCGVVEKTVGLLPNGQPKIFVQLGDFGIWEGVYGVRFLNDLTWVLGKNNSYLLFVCGNHECFPLLEKLTRDSPEPPEGSGIPTGARKVTERIWHAPRGLSWSWQGKRWVACGGAVSVDKALRTEGLDWWPQEEITNLQVELFRHMGKVDVLLTHDRPSRFFIHLPPWPLDWDLADKVRAELHRDKVDIIYSYTQPELLLHGHYHQSHILPAGDTGSGNGVVVAMSRDGEPNSVGFVDCHTLEFGFLDV